MNTIEPTKTQPELDAERELAQYIQKCRIMHSSIVGSPRFAHAISALADKCDALEARVKSLTEAAQIAADALRNLGCAVDADELEEVIGA